MDVLIPGSESAAVGSATDGLHIERISPHHGGMEQHHTDIARFNTARSLAGTMTGICGGSGIMIVRPIGAVSKSVPCENELTKHTISPNQAYRAEGATSESRYVEAG